MTHVVRDLQLLVLDAAALAEAGRSPEEYARRRRLGLGTCGPFLEEVACATAAYLAATPDGRDRWGAYLALDRGTRDIVGTCAFIAPPDGEGVVEIAYYTFPPHERQGVATAMAAALREEALRREEIRCVRAHTLPERNPSVRVLEKLGFTWIGEVTHAEDGLVWRWEWPRPRPGEECV